jgi:hypothetical protein
VRFLWLNTTCALPCPALLPSIPRLLLAVDASKLLAQLALPTSNNGDADGPADVVVIVRTTGQVHVPAPAAPRRLGARLVRVPSPPAPRHTGAHLPLLHVPLRARAHAAARGTGFPFPGGARALRGVTAPRRLPQVRAGAGARGAPARRQRQRAGRCRELVRARGRVLSHAAAEWRPTGVVLTAGSSRRGRGGALVEEAGFLAGRRKVCRARAREAGRRAAVARAQDGRVRLGEDWEPRSRCRAHDPGLPDLACWYVKSPPFL